MAGDTDYEALVESYGFAVMPADDLRAVLAHVETHGGTHVVFDRASTARDGVTVSGDDPQGIAREVADVYGIREPRPSTFEVGDVVSLPTDVTYEAHQGNGGTVIRPAGSEFAVVGIKLDPEASTVAPETLVYVVEPTEARDILGHGTMDWTHDDGPLTLVRPIRSRPDGLEVADHAPSMGAGLGP